MTGDKLKEAVTVAERIIWSRRQPLQYEENLKCGVFQGAKDMVSIYKKGVLAALK